MSEYLNRASLYMSLNSWLVYEILVSVLQYACVQLSNCDLANFWKIQE